MKPVSISALIVIAALCHVTSFAKYQEQQPGGGGGGNQANTNQFTIDWKDSDQVDRSSEIVLKLGAGGQQLLALSNDNPHHEILSWSNISDSAFVDGATQHGVLKNFFQVYFSAGTLSSYGIIASNPIELLAVCQKKDQGNVVFFKLENRKIVPPPPGSPNGTPSNYESYERICATEMGFSGAPVDPFFGLSASSSVSNATGPQMFGQYSHSRSIAGDLEINWSITLQTKDGPDPIVYNPDFPERLPFREGSYKIKFNETVVDPTVDYIIALPPILIDTKGTVYQSVTGFSLGATLTGVTVGVVEADVQ